MCVIATHASANQALVELPFNGSVYQTEQQDIAFPDMTVEGTGSGQATLLGSYISTDHHQVDLLTGEGVGTAEFIAANGDTILTTIEALGLPDPDAPGYFRVTEHHTIVGGTGRFEGARGTFTLVRLINDQHVSAGSFDGTIVFAKGK
jgi:hypothetical protein